MRRGVLLQPWQCANPPPPLLFPLSVHAKPQRAPLPTVAATAPREEVQALTADGLVTIKCRSNGELPELFEYEGRPGRDRDGGWGAGSFRDTGVEPSDQCHGLEGVARSADGLVPTVLRSQPVFPVTNTRPGPVGILLDFSNSTNAEMVVFPKGSRDMKVRDGLRDVDFPRDRQALLPCLPCA